MATSRTAGFITFRMCCCLQYTHDMNSSVNEKTKNLRFQNYELVSPFLKKQKNNNNICCVVDNFTHFLTNSCSCSDVFCNLDASVSFLAYDCPSIVPCFCLDGFLISLSPSFDYLTYLSFMVLHPAGVLWSRLIYWINGMCIHFSLLWLSSRAPNFILFFPPFPIVASDNFPLIRTLR